MIRELGHRRTGSTLAAIAALIALFVVLPGLASASHAASGAGVVPYEYGFYTGGENDRYFNDANDPGGLYENTIKMTAAIKDPSTGQAGMCQQLGYQFGMKWNVDDNGAQAPDAANSQNLLGFGFSVSQGSLPEKSEWNVIEWWSTEPLYGVVLTKTTSEKFYAYSYDGATGDTSLATANNNGNPEPGEGANLSNLTVCWNLVLEVSKTADARYDLDRDWSITKTVNGKASDDIFLGAAADYVITLDSTDNEVNHRVTSTIEVTNPYTVDMGPVSVTDSVDEEAPVDITDQCIGDGWNAETKTLAAGTTMTCTHETDGESEGDLATATYTYTEYVGVGQTDEFEVSETDDAVHSFAHSGTTIDEDHSGVTDTQDDLSGGLSYSKVLGEGLNQTNTACVAETTNADADNCATAIVNVYRISVDKTLESATYDRDLAWNITKTVDAENVFLGATPTYTVTVELVDDSPVNHQATGTIAITNPAPIPATVTVYDPTAGISETVTVPTGTHPFSDGWTIEDAGAFTNTVSVSVAGTLHHKDTVTWDYEDSGHAYNLEPPVLDGVTDTNSSNSGDLLLWGEAVPSTGADRLSPTVGDSFTWTYSIDWLEEGTHLNIACVYYIPVTADQQVRCDDAQVTVYKVTVVKTVDSATYDTPVTWGITKTAWDTSHDVLGPQDVTNGNISLAAGATVTISYELDVTAVEGQAENHQAMGTIEITNPAPMDATVDVVDLAAGIDTQVTVPANSSLFLDDGWTITSSPSTMENTVDVSVDGTLHGSDTVGWAYVQQFVDGQASISDSLYNEGAAASLDHDAVGDGPEITYPVTYGPYYDCAVDVVLPNIATLTAGAQKIDSSATVTVDVSNCGTDDAGTLTQGFWKTHHADSLSGVPDDKRAWDSNEFFFGTELTWLEMFNVQPRGNAFVILAHQYMAASLNVENGAPLVCGEANIGDSLDAAADLLSAHSEGNWERKPSKATADAMRDLATLLDDYNNGLLEGCPHLSND